MLVQACEEVTTEGKIPETDAAVALISGRIGFCSPADSLSSDGWQLLVDLCSQGKETVLQLRKDAVQ